MDQEPIPDLYVAGSATEDGHGTVRLGFLAMFERSHLRSGNYEGLTP